MRSLTSPLRWLHLCRSCDTRPLAERRAYYRYEVHMTADGAIEVDDGTSALDVERLATEDAVESVMLGSPHVTYSVELRGSD